MVCNTALEVVPWDEIKAEVRARLLSHGRPVKVAEERLRIDRFEDCRTCHAELAGLHRKPPHRQAACGACHKPAMNLLSATATKHKTVLCVKCHKDKHKFVPACTQCHTKLHPASILKKFPKCSMCHSIAHDLNNWKEHTGPVSGDAKPAKAGKKK